MSDPMKIEVGDVVNVFWDYLSPEWNCTVRYFPQDTGDSWQLTREDGTPVRVMFFGKMELVKKGERSA